MTYAYNTHGAPAVGGGLPGLPIRQIAQPDSEPLSGEMVFSESPPEVGEWVALDGGVWDARLSATGISPIFSGQLPSTEESTTRNRVEDVSFSPDSLLLALACPSSNSTILTLSAPSSTFMSGRWTSAGTSFTGAAAIASASAVAYSPRGDLVVFGGTGMQLVTRTSETAFNRLATTNTFSCIKEGLAFSHDGDYLYAAINQSPWFQIFKVNGSALTPITSTGVSLSAATNGLKLSRDGRFLAILLSSGGAQVFRVDGADLTPVSISSGLSVISADFSEDGSTLVTAGVTASGSGNQPSLFRLTDGGYIKDPSAFPQYRGGGLYSNQILTSIAISKDGNTVCMGFGDATLTTLAAEPTARIYLKQAGDFPVNTRRGAAMPEPWNSSGMVRCMAFSPDGLHLVAGASRTPTLNGAAAVKPMLTIGKETAYVKVD